MQCLQVDLCFNLIGNVKVKSLSHVRLFATPWTVAYQAPQSMGFSRQEYWSGLPFPSPGDLPNPGIEPGSPALQTDALPSEPLGKPKALINLIFLTSSPGRIINVVSYLPLAQSCLTLCDPMDSSLPSSAVHGIFQARILEWAGISFSRGSSQSRDQTRVSCIADRRFTV